MKSRVNAMAVVVCVLACATVAVGQAPPPAGKAAPPASEPPTTTQPAEVDEVAVTVNGQAVMVSQIDEAINSTMGARMPDGKVSADQLVQHRKRFGPQIVDMLVTNLLMDMEVEAAGISLTDKDLADWLEADLQRHLKSRGLTREEFAEQIKKQPPGKPLDEVIADRLADPRFKQSVLQTKYIEKKFDSELTVTDAQVAEDYKKNFERRYRKAPQVRASHILIKTNKKMTGEEKALAREKIETVLAEVKKPDADFKVLAGLYSGCSSWSKGGDLGFFPRKGKMVEPFSAAAFELEAGAMSDIVETQFGYHIIKVTDKKAEEVTLLEEVKDTIREQLRSRKLQSMKKKHIGELKKTAEIVYPEGSPYKMAARPPTPVVPTTRPTAGRKAPRPITIKPSAPKAPPKPTETPPTAKPTKETPTTE